MKMINLHGLLSAVGSCLSCRRVDTKHSAYLFALLCAMAAASTAQTFTTLINFDGSNGARPFDNVVQGLDGNFYGTTYQGGANNYGTVFKISSSGQLTTIYNFCVKTNCTDGANPYGPLVLGSDGYFYGTTLGGGALGHGIIFKISPVGKITKLYAFCRHHQGGPCRDGSGPETPLVEGTDGNFYGTTLAGGEGKSGVMFRITPQGGYTLLYTFCSKAHCTDGTAPDGGLIQAADGSFYGASFKGGTHGVGTIFKITTAGQLTILYDFCSLTNCADGAYPVGALVQAVGGIFYGTAGEGGANNYGSVFTIAGSGQLTTLYSFCTQTGCPSGGFPNDLVQGPAGNFYGTANTIFKITPSGQFTVLYTPDRMPNGITLGTDGKFYGTTNEGGTSNAGFLFSLAVGLGPFVQTVQASGKVGAPVTILGTKLTGVTSVTFNGTEAAFTVKSSSEITTTVPSGATTGKVQVTTPEHKLSTNVPFRVTK
jgi:uncharacterized repeat protein (TIGR03803 family)